MGLEKWRHAVRASAVGVGLGCATTAAPSSAGESRPAPADNGANANVEPSVPSGDTLTIRRTGCPPGRCPDYELTLFASGHVLWMGHRSVTRVGKARGEVDAGLAKTLLAAAAALDLKEVPGPDDPVACATDMPSVSVTQKQPGVTTRSWVNMSCVVDLCWGEAECSNKACEDRLAERGYSRDAMAELWAFAERVDKGVDAERWADDPDCRKLRRERFAPVAAEGDALLQDTEDRTRASQVKTIRQRLADRPNASVWIRGISTDPLRAEAQEIATALQTAGVPKDRIVQAWSPQRRGGPGATTLTVIVAAPKCFPSLDEAWRSGWPL